MLNLGVLIDRDVGIAAQIGESIGSVMLLSDELLAAGVVGLTGLLELLTGGRARGDQLLLPLALALVVGDGVPGRLGVGLLLVIGRLHRVDLQPFGGELRLGLLDRDAERARIEAEENSAGFDLLIVAHGD